MGFFSRNWLFLVLLLANRTTFDFLQCPYGASGDVGTSKKEQLLMETLHHPAELQPTVSSERWTGVGHRQVQGLACCGKLTPTAFWRLARLRREGSLFPSSGPATCTAATQQESGSLPPRIFSTTPGLQQHRALQDRWSTSASISACLPVYMLCTRTMLLMGTCVLELCHPCQFTF